MSDLAELGIRLRRDTPGERRAACPQCARAKPRGADDALAVKLEPDDGATWLCHRCGWRGALRAADERAVERRVATTLRAARPEPPAAVDVPGQKGRAICGVR
jgi:hypothetical protein